MTWGELKALAEKDGVKDTDIISIEIYTADEITDTYSKRYVESNYWEVC